MAPKAKKSERKSSRSSADKREAKANELSSKSDGLAAKESVVETATVDEGKVVPPEVIVDSVSTKHVAEMEYEEPPANKYVVARYEGPKVRGLYDGEGRLEFIGGNVYEGLFHEGFMHGSGRLTWTDGVIYEGEFNGNVITGEGSFLWPDGSTYTGGVVNGKRHGIGKFISCDGKTYSGEWHCGFRHGKGKLIYDEAVDCYYDGDWIMNERFGWGMMKYKSGNVYEGMWVHNVRHGEGTMRWLERDECYTGQWNNGIQHGKGVHIWYLKRVPGSQYALRNMYDGDFVQSKRQGVGTFYYANGSKYEGEWENNFKMGNGKYTFKNGQSVEGNFEDDHLVDYPSYHLESLPAEDIEFLRIHSASPSRGLSSLLSRAASHVENDGIFLSIQGLLKTLPADIRSEEHQQVKCAILRHLSNLKKIYCFYSSLGYGENVDNTFVMIKLQFWRLLKDCKVDQSRDITLTEIDRHLGDLIPESEMHSPFVHILLRDFYSLLVYVAYRLYSEEFSCGVQRLAQCFDKLMREHLLQFSCQLRGNFFKESRRAINALGYVVQSSVIYNRVCSKRKVAPFDPTLTCREFLIMLHDFKLYNERLTSSKVVEILGKDNPKIIEDGCCTVTSEMSFLEFFEALIGCAEVDITGAMLRASSDAASPLHITSNSALGREFTMDSGISMIASQCSISSPHPVSRGMEDPALHTTINIIPPQSRENTLVIEDKRTESSKHSELPERRTGVAFDEKVIVEDAEPSTVHTAAEDDLIELDDIDEANHQFNFWTHQLHYFFYNRLFPAADHYEKISQLLRADRTVIAQAKPKTETPTVQLPVETVPGQEAISVH